MRLFAAELLKIRTAPRTSLGLVVGMLGLVALGSITTATTASGPFRDEFAARDILSVASLAAVFTLILGILVVTWEYRHGTITQTFLASPRREQVMAAKFAVSLVAGAVLAVLCVLLALIVIAVWFGGELDRGHYELAARIVLGAALWGVLGAGLGALVQSQVGAIIGSFLWFLVAEPLIGFQLDTIGDYLPGSALDRLQDTTAAAAQGSGSSEGSGPVFAYSATAAALIAAAYAAGLALLGTLAALRRDVP